MEWGCDKIRVNGSKLSGINILMNACIFVCILINLFHMQQTYKLVNDKVAPGPIANTPGTTKLAPGFTADDVEDMMKEGIPMGRLGTAFDIGMAAVYLACDASGGYVSGDVLVVDGAEWLYKPPMVPKEMVAELSRKVEAKSRALQPKMVSKL